MFKKYHQLVVGRHDIQILELHYFFIPSNFIRIKVHYSAISVGSESTTLKSKSILETRKHKNFFAKLGEKFLSRRLYITLKKMIKTKSSFGYSLVGEVVGLGDPDKFLTGVIEVHTDTLHRIARRGDGVGAGELKLLYEVFVRQLGETTALISIKEHIINPQSSVRED